METTKQVHAVIPVSVARAAGYPQPWLLVMHDKLRVDDVVAVIAYDDRETLLTTPLQEGHVITRSLATVQPAAGSSSSSKPLQSGNNNRPHRPPRSIDERSRPASGWNEERPPER